MTRGFTRILVPTDFSPQSAAALATAREMAARFGASIEVLHVLEDPYSTAAYAAEVYGYLPPGLKEQWQEQAERHMEELLTTDDRVQFGARATVLFGPSAKTIVEHAVASKIDLIVMGTHGRGGVAHLLLGSVTERVVRTAFCPVMTVRGVAPEPVKEENEAAAVPVAV